MDEWVASTEGSTSATQIHVATVLAVDALQLTDLLDQLEHAGFTVTADWLPSRIELKAGDGRVLDVHPVAFDESGAGRQDGLDAPPFLYAADAFTTGNLNGQSIPCLSARQQRRFRTGYELREVDHHDLDLLNALTDDERDRKPIV